MNNDHKEKAATQHNQHSINTLCDNRGSNKGQSFVQQVGVRNSCDYSLTVFYSRNCCVHNCILFE
jgi:hypothetical protein